MLVAKCFWQYSVPWRLFPEKPPMHQTWVLSHCPVGNRSGQFRPQLIDQSFISRERSDLMVFSSNMGQIFFFVILLKLRYIFETRSDVSWHASVLTTYHTRFCFWRWGNNKWNHALSLKSASSLLFIWKSWKHRQYCTVHAPTLTLASATSGFL